MLLAGLPSARADQKTIDARVFHCDVLVRALGLDGLHKHKAQRCNQHSQKAQTLLDANLDRSALSLPARREKKQQQQ